MNTIAKQPMLPDTINFFSTSDDRTEVMRITRDGVFVNPEIKPDDAAKAVLDALNSQIKVLVQRAVEDEREACAKVAEEWQLGIDDPRYQADCATAIRARGEK